jgi:hypothetical protein
MTKTAPGHQPAVSEGRAAGPLDEGLGTKVETTVPFRNTFSAAAVIAWRPVLDAHELEN